MSERCLILALLLALGCDREYCVVFPDPPVPWRNCDSYLTGWISLGHESATCGGSACSDKPIECDYAEGSPKCEFAEASSSRITTGLARFNVESIQTGKTWESSAKENK